MTLPPQSEGIIDFLSSRLLDNKDFIFKLSISCAHVTLYVYLLDHTTRGVMVRNKLDRLVQILHFFRLGVTTEVFYKNCFQVDFNYSYTICSSENPNWQSNPTNPTKVSALKPLLENYLPDKIMIYCLPEVVKPFEIWYTSFQQYERVKDL